MIKIYYRGSCISSQHTIAWFESKNIEIELIKVSKMSTIDLINVLRLSDDGFSSILKKSLLCPHSKKYLDISSQIEKMKFNEAVMYLKRHSCLLKTPLILEDEKVISGFNNEELRQFIPRTRKRIEGDQF